MQIIQHVSKVKLNTKHSLVLERIFGFRDVIQELNK
jgi:hypothetical protein